MLAFRLKVKPALVSTEGSGSLCLFAETRKTMTNSIDSIDEALFEITDGYELGALVRVSTIVDILLDIRSIMLEGSDNAQDAFLDD